MKNVVNKIVISLLATVLLAQVISVSPMFIMPVHAADVTTYAFIDVSPNPVLLGQTVTVTMRITPFPSPYTFSGLLLSITDPNGGEPIVLGSFETDPNGEASTTYTFGGEFVPLGTYHFQLVFPEQYIGEGGDKYLQSTSSTDVIVQEYISPGPDQTIYPDPNVVMHFEYVATGGTVTVTPSEVAPNPPLDPGASPYYYISASGGLTFTGKVTIGIHYYDTTTPAQEETIGLWRFDPAVQAKGDVDNSGKVDLKDVLFITLAWGARPGQRRWNPAYDLNGDLRIDWKDTFIAIQNYGKTSAPNWTNITTRVDKENNWAYGDTDHFSPYRVHY
jgi:hypothetical protein